MESQHGDDERGQNLNGDLDVQRIEKPPEDPLIPPGLLPDTGHDPLFEERRRFHFSESLHEFFRLLQVCKGPATSGTGVKMPRNIFLFCG